MVSLAMRKALLNAFDRGEPYPVCPLPSAIFVLQTDLLTALRERGLITEGIDPVLTPAGIEEAKWFKGTQ